MVSPLLAVLAAAAFVFSSCGRAQLVVTVRGHGGRTHERPLVQPAGAAGEVLRVNVVLHQRGGCTMRVR